MVQLTSMIPSATALVAIVLMAQQPGAQAAAAIDLGDCVDFAVMAGTQVSFNGGLTTVAVGNVGVSPGTVISGSYVISDGSAEANTAAAVNCASSMLTAYNAAVGTTCTNTTAPTDLGGITLTAGVYCNAAGYFLLNAGALTLTGSSSDVWIFQAATSVTTASSTSIILAGGAVASNVFWQTGTTLETGASSTFLGTVLSGTSITMGTSSVLNGRALAQAAMTCSDSNTITSFLGGGDSFAPSMNPTVVPSATPSASPSAAPSVTPSATPSVVPSIATTDVPSLSPSVVPSAAPSVTVTAVPSFTVTAIPTYTATDAPSAAPSVSAAPVTTSLRPSANPTFAPTSAADGSSLSSSKMAMIGVMSLLGVVGVMVTV